MATITITQTGSHIIFTDSVGSDQTILVPKRGLTILRRQDKGDSEEYVYLNWNAGGTGKALQKVFHRDWYKIKYSAVSSPTLASNVALLNLLKEYASTVDDTGAVAVGWYGQDLINDTVSHGGEWKSCQVLVAATFTTLTDDGDKPSTGLTGVSLPAGTFITSNGRFTSIKLSAGTILAVRGGINEGFTTSTTTTTTTT